MPEIPHAVYIVFLLALGACVGSFLNVVVWRLPRMEGDQIDTGWFSGFRQTWQTLSYPSSHCPKCNKPLKWYDNIPVIGWIKLGGKCRFCKQPISIRYPIVEALTGLLFAFYYVMYFMVGFAPGCRQLDIVQHWPIYFLDMMLIGGLLAATLIDAEFFIIPLEIPWFVVPFAFVEHAVWDRPGWPGALNLSTLGAALTAGAAVGLLVSIILWYFEIIPSSFAEGGPLMEIEKRQLEMADGAQPPREFSSAEIRSEMRKEMLFLLPPMILGCAWLLATWKLPAMARWWDPIAQTGWVSGLLGSILGLLVGGFVVWVIRIVGSYAFGREAMGMGDVHLMAAVGAVLGPGTVTIAFFLAPFFGIIHAIYLLFSKKGRELPLGPYLALGTAAAMVFYCQIADYLSPGLYGLLEMVSQWLGWS
jgi:leader peptidase (prepilin peptidase)/N-methyltransferase